MVAVDPTVNNAIAICGLNPKLRINEYGLLSIVNALCHLADSAFRYSILASNQSLNNTSFLYILLGVFNTALGNDLMFLFHTLKLLTCKSNPNEINPIDTQTAVSTLAYSRATLSFTSGVVV